MSSGRWVDRALWVVAFGAVGLTLWFSLGPAPPGTGSDRQAHALAYFVDTLALLLALVWRPGGRGRGGATTWTVAAGLLVLGGLLELVQAMVGRDAQLADWVADACGVVLGVAVFGALRWGLRERPA